MNKCINCNKDLEGKRRKWCSNICQKKYWSISNITKFKFICKECNNTFYKRGRVNGLGKMHIFCCRTCANKNNGQKKIIEKTRHKTQGYVSLWKPDHPRAYSKRIREHVFVIENFIGRYLNKCEIVHHKNYIENDNRIENLFLCKDKYVHYKIHKDTRYLLKEFIRERNLQKDVQEYMDKHYFNKSINFL